MGIDWIDDILQKAEGWPLVGGAVHQLRFAYEIWRETPADPGPVNAQGQSLGDLYTTAVGLRDALNESLVALSQTWEGDAATAYLGPTVTAFQVEHDMEPTTTGTGYQLWQNLAGITDLLNYNSGAHNTIGQHLQKIQDLHGTLDFQVKLGAGTLLAMAATIEIPGVDVVTDGGGVAVLTTEEAPAAAGAAEGIIEVEETEVEAQEIETAAKVAPWVIALAVGALAIVGVSIVVWTMHVPKVDKPPTYPQDCPPNPVEPLTPDQQKILNQLLQNLRNKGGRWVIFDEQSSLLKRLIRMNPGKSAQELLEMLIALGNQFPNLSLADLLGMTLNQGLSPAQIAQMECMGLTPPFHAFDQLTRIRDQFPAFWNSLRDHLSPEDINGAWREAHGCGTSGDFDHQQEVEGVQASAQNLLDQINRALSNPNTPLPTQDYLRSLAALLGKLISYITNIVNGPVEPGVVNPVGFLQSLISTMLPYSPGCA